MRHQCHNGDKEIVPITALVPQWADFLVPIEVLLLYLVELVLQWGLWIMYCPHLGTTILRHIVTHARFAMAVSSEKWLSSARVMALINSRMCEKTNPNPNPKCIKSSANYYTSENWS